MQSPKLRNPEWQAALQQALPHLQRFQDQLNAISDDLRVLEKTLTDSGFRIETRVSTENGEALAWTEHGKAAWRICVIEWVGDNEYEQRPLIEAPASIRWRVARFVPALLEEIASAANSAPRHVEAVRELTDDDIPF